MSTVDEISSFGYWVRRRRKVLDLTQGVLAQQVGCAVATIKKIEADERRPSRQMAERLAECLAIPQAEQAAFLRAARAELSPARLVTPLRIEDTPLLPQAGLVTPTGPSRPRHNLPVPANRLVGRANEVANLCRHLQQENMRLLTLTGPGGIGKTRLALQVMHDLLPLLPAEFWFVALAPVQDTVLVIPTIAQTLGVSAPAHQPIFASLKAYLRNRQTVLFLDNFEHIIDTAPQISELLAVAPALKVLVTSRAVLHLSGEHEFSVPPLRLPERADQADLARLAECEAVQLFVERAQAVGANFALTAENAAQIANICLRLEGLPLALELAAARCKLFTPRALLRRLEHRLRVLTSGTRDQPLRQQTLRATLDWSYQLLQSNEQILFAHLSVFVGGFTLEAVEAVCHESGGLALDIVEGVTALLDQSLIDRVETPNGEHRFMMLETMREYAHEQLLARGEEAALRNQHAAYFLALAERVQPLLYSAEQEMWFQRLIQEQSNFRAALQWLHAANDYGRVARLSAALTWFWWKHGEIREEIQWAEWALAEMDRHPESIPPAVRAKAIYSVALGAGSFGNFVRARSLCEEYLAMEEQPASFLDLYNVLGDLADFVMWEGDFQRATILDKRLLALSQAQAFPNGVANSLMHLGYIAFWQGQVEEAEKFWQESFILRKEVGSVTGMAFAYSGLGMVAYEQGNLVQARLLLQQSLELVRTLDDKQGIGFCSSELGVVAQLQQAYAEAAHYQRNALLIMRELGFQPDVSIVLTRLGNLALVQNDLAQAHACFAESLANCQQIGQRISLAASLEGLAGVAVRSGNATQAAHWLGAAAASRQAIGVARGIDERDNYAQTIAMTRSVLGDTLFDAAIVKGRATALNDIITEALSTSNDLDII